MKGFCRTLVSQVESVVSLMREVECQEEAAKQAKEEADQSVLDTLVKLEQCKIALRDAHEMNDMVCMLVLLPRYILLYGLIYLFFWCLQLDRKLYVQKAVLATKMEAFQLHTLHLLDDGDRFSELVDEVNAYAFLLVIAYI